jgi:hypothetical protein
MTQSNDAAGPSSSSSSSSSFPAKEVLLTAGTGFFLGMFYFYKRKQTLPFKVRLELHSRPHTHHADVAVSVCHACTTLIAMVSDSNCCS